jgi:hypothetical protein
MPANNLRGQGLFGLWVVFLISMATRILMPVIVPGQTFTHRTLKQFRAIAARYDKTARNFLAAILPRRGYNLAQSTTRSRPECIAAMLWAQHNGAAVRIVAPFGGGLT